MVEIKVYSAIDKPDALMSMFGLDELVFSADAIHQVFEEQRLAQTCSLCQ